MNKQYESKQTSNYILSLVVFAAVFMIMNIVATQYVASSLHYHPALGNPILANIYNPFGWIMWETRFWNTHSYFFKTLNIVMFAAYAVAFIVFFLVRILGRRKAQVHDDVHGSAHWMSEKELYKTGLIQETKGIYVGGYEDQKKNMHYLKHDGPEHCIALAPTRSGKGVGLVLPTLLAWEESVIVLDIKGENFALTAGWRKKYANNHILRFEPTATEETDTIKYNPLEEVRVGHSSEIADVQNISMMICDPEGKGLADYWQKSAFSLINGLILYTIHTAKENGLPYPSLPTVYETLNGEEISSLLEKMKDHSHATIKLVGREMLNKAEQELSGVVGSAASYLNLYADPIVSKNTSKSEFKIHDLMNSDKPVSLYLIIQPSDKDRLMPLVRLMVNQILRKLVEKMEFEDGKTKKSYKHKMLLMFDEFTSLGKLDIFQESLAYMAGYGIKAFIIIQDTAQLHNAYGKDEAITSNCHIKIAFAPNKIETAEWLSKMTGTTTITKSMITTSGKRLGLVLGQVSESMQEVSRPLMTPDECMRLKRIQTDVKDNVTGGGEMLIFIAGQAPILGKQILFFKDDAFLARSQVPTPKHLDIFTGNISISAEETEDPSTTVESGNTPHKVDLSKVHEASPENPKDEDKIILDDSADEEKTITKDNEFFSEEHKKINITHPTPGLERIIR